MSLAEAHQSEAQAFDVGARVVSPLIAQAEDRLPANVTAVAPLAGGSRVAFALGDGTVRLRDIETDGGKPAFGAGETVLARHAGAATALQPFGEGAVSAGQDGRIYRWTDGAAAPVPLFDFGGCWVDAFAVHDGKGLVAAAATRRLVLIDRDGRPLFEHDGFPSAVSGLSFSPDGRRLAAAHLDGVSIFAAAGEREHLLGWKGSHIGVSWSPDGRYVVSATQEREFHVWDLVTLGDLRLGGYPHKIHGMQWLAPGPFLVCTGADVITAWSFAEGGPGGKPPIEIGYVYDGLVTAVAANPRRPLVAGGYSTGSVLIGGVVKGEALLARAGLGDAVTAMAWTADGTRLLAGTAGGHAVAVDIPAGLSVQ